MPNDSPFTRGDIWLTDFGIDPENPEQAIQRPAVLVSDDRLHHPSLRMVIVVPGTSTIRDIPIHVDVGPDPTNGLSSKTAFQTEQVRAVSTTRLVERLGKLDPVNIATIDEVLRNVLNL